jgi:hypothetical protein
MEEVLRETDVVVYEGQQSFLQSIEEHFAAVADIPETIEVDQESRLAGFPVTDKVRVQNPDRQAVRELEAGRERVEQFQRTRTELKSELADVGIETIAVLPTSIWQQLCQHAGLYRMEHIDADGNVGARLEGLSDALTFTSVHLIIGAIGLLIGMLLGAPLLAYVGFVVAFVGTLYMAGSRFLRSAGSIMPCIMANATAPAIVTTSLMWGSWSNGFFFAPVLAYAIWMCISFVVLAFMPDNPASNARFYAGLLARFVPKKTMLRWMFRDGHDYRHIGREGAPATRTEQVRITFPKPPADVEAVLRRAREHGYELKVAAVPDAVRIDFASFVSALQSAIEKDPVVYVEKNGATAIIAQFGEFQDEKRLVEAVKKMDVTSF